MWYIKLSQLSVGVCMYYVTLVYVVIMVIYNSRWLYTFVILTSHKMSVGVCMHCVKLPQESVSIYMHYITM